MDKYLEDFVIDKNRIMSTEEIDYFNKNSHKLDEKHLKLLQVIMEDTFSYCRFGKNAWLKSFLDHGWEMEHFPTAARTGKGICGLEPVIKKKGWCISRETKFETVAGIPRTKVLGLVVYEEDSCNFYNFSKFKEKFHDFIYGDDPPPKLVVSTPLYDRLGKEG